MSSDPLQPRIDLHAHTVTVNAGARLMKLTQSIVTNAPERLSVLHEIHVHDNERIGYYRCIIYDAGGKKVSHIFDIPILLEMRDTWREYVEKRVNKMIGELK